MSSVLRCLLLFALAATSIRAHAEDDYFVCRIVTQVAPQQTHSLTGFKVRGVEGIYTALHGVAHAQSITAFFHDPNTRQVKLKIAEVDLGRDVAVLTSVENEAIPSGGLSLGFWPKGNAISAKLAGTDATVIGHPLDIERIPTHTPLKLRTGRPYARLTDILNSEARGELGDRKSPLTSINVLVLEGNFLPGHSGAPILDSDRAVIGIGNGGLRDGQVGYGWAIPFHEVELQPMSPSMQTQIAQLPSFRRSKQLFLVSVPEDQQQTQLISQVTTFVESDDGSPILGLKNLPEQELHGELNRLKEILQAIREGDNDRFSAAGEFERIMKNRVYLPSGTPVTLLEDPKKLGSPVAVPSQPASQGTEAMPAFQFSIGQLFTMVQVSLGDNKTMELYVPTVSIRRRTGVVINAPNNLGVIVAGNNTGMIAGGNITINNSPKAVKKLILSNDGGATLIMRDDGTEVMRGIGDPEKHLGIAIHGTEIKLLEGVQNFGPVIEFRKVEILSGEFKGQRGWVSKNAIRDVTVPETSNDR